MCAFEPSGLGAERRPRKSGFYRQRLARASLFNAVFDSLRRGKQSQRRLCEARASKTLASLQIKITEEGREARRFCVKLRHRVRLLRVAYCWRSHTGLTQRRRWRNCQLGCPGDL